MTTTLLQPQKLPPANDGHVRDSLTADERLLKQAVARCLKAQVAEVHGKVESGAKSNAVPEKTTKWDQQVLKEVRPIWFGLFKKGGDKALQNIRRFPKHARKMAVLSWAEIEASERVEVVEKGGPGSGNFGHEGRPGEVGGSGGGDVGGNADKESVAMVEKEIKDSYAGIALEDRQNLSNYAGGGSIEQVDAAVKVPVKMINALGFDTIASCEGHKDNWTWTSRLGDDPSRYNLFQQSYVVVQSPDRNKLESFLKDKGFQMGSSPRDSGGESHYSIYKNYGKEDSYHLEFEVSHQGAFALRVGSHAIDSSSFIEHDLSKFGMGKFTNLAPLKDKTAYSQDKWDKVRDEGWAQWVVLLNKFQFEKGSTKSLKATPSIVIPEWIEDPDVLTALENEMFKFAHGINQTTADDLRAELIAGMENGETIPQLADRISGLSDEWVEGWRSEMIARTETARAFSTGHIEAWRSTGVVSRKIWVSSQDACPFCLEMDGTVIDLDENFFDQGDDPQKVEWRGHTIEMGADYSDIGGPPRHPNCRCVLVAELDEEKAIKKGLPIL